jgi:hypothetical protein
VRTVVRFDRPHDVCLDVKAIRTPEHEVVDVSLGTALRAADPLIDHSGSLLRTNGRRPLDGSPRAG